MTRPWKGHKIPRYRETRRRTGRPGKNIHTDTLEYIVTDKLDPTIGSTRKTQQDRNLTVETEPILMKSSISKFNRDEHAMSTEKKVYYDIKQADKDKESQEIPRHSPNYVV
jgi:hypothetical protein